MLYAMCSHNDPCDRADNISEDHSVAGALFQTCGQIGGSLGICLSALISSEITKKQGDLLAGSKSGYWYSASTSFFGKSILLSTRHRHRHSHSGPYLSVPSRWQSLAVRADGQWRCWS
jgi:hypothetical protein